MGKLNIFSLFTEKKTKKLAVVVTSLFLVAVSGVFLYQALAAGITPATGGTNISLDTSLAAPGAGYTNLTNISITESAAGEIGLGWHTFMLPAGFRFDPSSVITIGADWSTGFSLGHPNTVVPQSITNYTTFKFNVTALSNPGDPVTVNLSGLRIQATSTVPMSGVITHSGTTNGTPGSTGAIVAVTDGVTSFGSVSSVAGASVRLVITGSAAQTAGVSNELTITAQDQFGNTATSYTGSKSLTFSGLTAAPDGNTPQIEGTNLGTATSVTFTSGVSNTNAATLVAYKAEAGSMDVTDGTINSTGDAAYDLDLTVNPATAARLEMTAASGTMDAGSNNELTITAKDAFGNVDTNYDDAKNLTFFGIGNAPAGNAPTVEGSVITAPISINFTNGQSGADVATLITYKAEGPVELEVSDGTINSTGNAAYDVDLTVKHLAADHLKFSGAVGAQTAGAQFALPALNVVDIYGNVASGANGATAYSQTDTVAYTLSGTANGPTSGTDAYTTSVTFVNGTSTTALNTTLYRAQSTTITANGPLAGTDEASNSFTVNAAAASAVNITTQPGNTNGTVDNPLQQQPVVSVTDQYGNTNSNGETVSITLDTGSGALLNNSTITLNGIGTFTDLKYNKSGETFSMHFTVNAIDSAVSDVVTALNPGAVTTVTVSGDDPIVSGIQSSSYTAVSKDQYNNTVSDTYTWTKTDGTGTATLSVDKLTGVLVGNVTIKATGLNAVFGTKAVTVNVGAASQVRVETAANGSGIVVLAQTLAPLQTLTVYAITRDVNNNFVANVAAVWTTESETGGVIDTDLTPAGDNKSVVFTGGTGGTGVIRATVGALTGDSGVITVQTLTEVYVATTGNDSNPGTSGSPKLTIQNAVDAVATNGTVNVAAGTYTGSTNVNKVVTIIGASSDTTIIDPAAGDYGFKITASSTISNLQIQPAFVLNDTDDTGIMVLGTNNVTITGNKIISTSGSAGDGSEGSLGIWVCGTGSGCAASNNLNVVGNTITINGVSTGLYSQEVTAGHSGWKIIGNTITANDGVTLELYDVTSSTVTGNTLDGSTTNSNVIWSSELGNTGNLTFTNNTISDSSGSMVAFLSDFLGANDTSVTTVTVTGNTFNTWGSRGLRIGTDVTGVTVSTNNFTGGTGEAAKNESGSVITASGNTWSDFATNPGYPTAYNIFVSTGVYTGGTDSIPVGELDAAVTLVDASPASITVSNGGNTSTITVTAKGNNSGNLLSGIAIGKIVITSGNASSTISAITDAGSGNYTATIYSPLAGVDTISATIDGVAITDTANLTYVPDVLDYIAFTAEPATGGEAGANFAVQPVVKLYDQFNNILTTDSASQITLSAVLASDGVTAGAGVLSATTNPLTVTAGVATFSGVNYTGVDSIKLKAVTGAEVVLTGAIQNNPAVASYLTVTAASGTPTAGANNELAVRAYDAFGNLVNTGPNNYTGSKTLTFSGPAAIGSYTPTVEGVNVGTGASFTFTNGEASGTNATLVAYKAETVSVDVNDGTINSGGSPAYDADLTVAPAAIAAMDIGAAPNPLTTAQTSTVTVTGTDTYGNAITNDNSTAVSFLYSGDGLVLTPSAGGTLSSGVLTATLTKTSAGSVLITASATGLTQDSVTVTFTDGTAPQVTTNPTVGDINVLRTVQPLLTFSEAMTATTTIADNIKIKKYSDNSDVGASVTVVNSTQVRLTPATNLLYGTDYYYYISSAVKDANNISFVAWDDTNKDAHKFTTEAAETVAPTVVGWAPTDDTVNIALDAQIWTKFSEALDSSSVTSTNIQLRKYSDNSAVTVTRTLSEGDTKVTLTPTSPLAYGTQYYFFIGTGIKDVVGNSFAADTWYQAQKAQHEFTTLAGMTVAVYAEKTDATINDTYVSGWRYRYEMTLNTTETKLQVQFPTGWQKSGGGGSIATDGNMKMLIDESTGGQITGLWDESLITGGSGNVKSYSLSTTYAGQSPLQSAIDALDNNLTLAGRQLVFYVFTKIPISTPGGIYTASYGIQTSN